MKIMKIVYKSIAVFVLCWTLSSCGDFLERSAQDLMIPVTTRHFKEIFNGDGNLDAITQSYLFVNYMTDDVEFFDGNGLVEDAGRTWSIKDDSRFETFKDSYLWADEVESSSFSDGAMEYFYKRVLVANVCLEAVDASEGTVEEKEILRGQASFLRAFSYFVLANLYAKPYNMATPDDLCIPLKQESTATTSTFARATIAQVWGQIKADLDVAIRDLKNKEISSIYEINYKAVLILATRVALYMEDWDSVISYGEEYRRDFGTQHPLYDISNQYRSTATTTGSYDATVRNFFNVENKELVWVFGNNAVSGTYNTYINGMGNSSIYWRISSPRDANVGFTVSSGQPEEEMKRTLIGQYNFTLTFATNMTVSAATGDRRPAYWFLVPKVNNSTSPSTRYNYKIIKYDFSDADFYGSVALRTGEVYLNLAEAYARKTGPDKTTAVRLLNDLRSKRINPYAGTAEELSVSTFPTDQALVDFIWQERRRELCFEELHRWWDLRRTTQPKIIHKWYTNTYTLQQGDYAYVLNFPIAEREYNGEKLVPNFRDFRDKD